MTNNAKSSFDGACIRRAILSGLAGTSLFLLLILLLSLTLDKSILLQHHSAIAVKIVLMISGLLVGLFAPGSAYHNRLLLSLTGEGILLIFLIVVCFVCGTTGSWLSIAVDITILLFGAFDGALRRGRKRIKQNGKRKYRA